MAEKFSGVRIVSEVAIEMRKAIIELAGSRDVFDSRQRWLERAADKAGISCRAAKSFFYCETANPNSSSVDKVRAARARKKKDESIVDAARATLAEMLARIQRLETAFRMADPDVFEPDVDALRDMASNLDIPVDRED